MLYHWIGGFASATNFIPFRGIKRWSWEIYWIIQGVAAWIVAPLLIASLLVPHLFATIAAAPHRSLFFAAFWGFLWGIGGLTFGLAIRYLGIALGYAIALGFCTAFGTLMPPLFTGQLGSTLHQASGRMVLYGVALCLLAIFVNGLAGYAKERELTEAIKRETGERDFSFATGLVIAVIAGIMSACFAYGLAAGKPLAQITRTRLLADGRLDLWQNLPVLVVVLWGGFLSNLIWSAALILRNRSGAQFFGAPGRNPMRATPVSGDTMMDLNPTQLGASLRLSSRTLALNYLLAIAAGVLWYFQFFFYSMGQTRMGRLDFSSWSLHMASIILFATLWGLVLREWRGTSLRTRLLVGCGIFLLIASTLVIGYGNYLKT